MQLEEFYSYDKDKLEKIIRERRPRTILLQLPEGLKHFFPSIIDFIKGLTPGIEVIHLDASPTFGSCLMDLNLVSKYDLVIHMGHAPYPYWKPPSNVVLIDLISRNFISSEAIDKLIAYLKDRSVRRVAIYTTAQHKIVHITQKLREHGIEIVNNVKQPIIFGCWFSDLLTIENRVDAVVIVAGGSFHGLGVGLSLTGSKHIIILDPYRDDFRDITKEVFRLKKVRYSKILRAMQANTWLIIVGTAGQYRPRTIERIVEMLQKKRKKFYLAVTTYLTLDTLANLDSDVIEAFTITTCPRLAVEDLSKYHKPVLTPGETIMALTGNLERYVFPW